VISEKREGRRLCGLLVAVPVGIVASGGSLAGIAPVPQVLRHSRYRGDQSRTHRPGTRPPITRDRTRHRPKPVLLVSHVKPRWIRLPLTRQ